MTLRRKVEKLKNNKFEINETCMRKGKYQKKTN